MVVESFQDDLHLLFEQVPVGVAVGVCAGSAVGVDLPGVIAPAHTENHTPFRKKVHRGEVFCQAKGMPHGGYVESATEFQVLGET